ncbi:MAG: non-ribosomal peptide synthetase, partial [bacterium]|nr:non-ribosomal peptide synthetase [bacterium]
KIKETAVLILTSEKGDKYLCAYIVPTDHDQNGTRDNRTGDRQLKEYVSLALPDYMVPRYYVYLENLPLTPNGKLDRRALPPPQLKQSQNYIAPRDHIEETMVTIWSDVLELEKTKISVRDNFFHLGGHSLKAVVMVAKLHQAFNVNVPLVELFKTPDINGLALYIKGAEQENFLSIEPVEKKEYYRLSPPQRRMYILQQMEPRSTVYNVPEMLPIHERKIDKRKLEKTFKKLVERHESLRTSFFTIHDQPVQKVHPIETIHFEIEYYNSTGEPPAYTTGAITGFLRHFDLSQAPLLRVRLLENEEPPHLLMVDMHHAISDGVSRQILKRDYMALYEEQNVTPLRIQYKDYSEWFRGESKKGNRERQEHYWLNIFKKDVPQLNLPGDYARPAVQSFEGADTRFRVSPANTLKLKNTARNEGATIYMVLLAIFNIFLAKMSTLEDIVVGTPVAGRRHDDLKLIIGMFVNTLAIRNLPEGKKTFNQFLRDVKETTLSAFENQEYPFEDLVDKVDINRDVSRNPL